MILSVFDKNGVHRAVAHTIRPAPPPTTVQKSDNNETAVGFVSPLICMVAIYQSVFFFVRPSESLIEDDTVYSFICSRVLKCPNE